MPRKGENIYKRKDGRWEGRYIKYRSENGKAVYGYLYAHSYRDLKQKLVIAKGNVQTDSQLSEEKEASKNLIVFGEIADSWMQTIRPQIKESTYIKYSNSLKNYILPEFKETNLTDITYSSLEAYASRLLLTGGMQNIGLSPKTVSDVLSIIHEVLIYADRHGYDINFKGCCPKIHQNSPHFTVLTKEEQTQFQKYLIENIDNKNFGLLFCLSTGIRIGEVCSLRWEDVSVAEKTVFIHSTMQRLQCEAGSVTKTKIIITTPKSKCSIRRIPLPECLLNIISNEFPNQSGYLLTGHETKFIEPRSMENHFKRVLKNCQIREVNFHTLRHTFATRCVELGFDIKCLSEILGHTSVNITMNRYVHPTMELKRDNMNRISDLFAVI